MITKSAASRLGYVTRRFVEASIAPRWGGRGILATDVYKNTSPRIRKIRIYSKSVVTDKRPTVPRGAILGSTCAPAGSRSETTY